MRTSSIVQTSILLFGLFESGAYASPPIIATLPGGIVFPALNDAAFQNAARMRIEKATSFQGLYTIGKGSTDSKGGLSAAYGNGKGGVGAGFELSNSYTTTALGPFAISSEREWALSRSYLGASVGSDDISAGVSLIQYGSLSSISPEIGLGLILGTGKKNCFAATIDGIGGNAVSTHLTLGYGYAELETYSLEANLIFPAFDQFGTSAFQGKLVGNIYIKSFGAGFVVNNRFGGATSSSNTYTSTSPSYLPPSSTDTSSSNSDLTFALSAIYWFEKHFSAQGQFDNSGVITLRATYAWE